MVDKVVSLKDRKKEKVDKIIRICPENDGLEMLYSTTKSEMLYSVKITLWALKESGEVVGLVPWLSKMTDVTTINNPKSGKFVGYRDPFSEEIFKEPPEHKVQELVLSEEYFRYEPSDDPDIHVVQQLMDTIGTHTIHTVDPLLGFHLHDVIGWRLYENGKITGLIVDEEKITTTPILPGDDALFDVESVPDFRFYFQYNIANKIKNQDEDIMNMLYMLFLPKEEDDE